MSSANQTISATVTAPNGCGWELVNLSPDMLTFDTMTNAGGTRTFDISVQNNPTASPRTGAVLVQRQNIPQAMITITQAPPSVEEPPPVCGTDCEPTDTRLLYYHADAIGSIRLITDANGNEFARYDFQPTGQEVGNNDTAPWNRVRFGGKERDPETKSSGFDALDYFGARYYQSQTGRFTRADPISLTDARLLNPQRLNGYAYALNNPFRYQDPLGLDPCSIDGYRSDDCEVVHAKKQSASPIRSGLRAVENYLYQTPWVFSLIIPILPEPGLIGVGPAFSFAWNPITRTACGGAGIGVAVGKAASIGTLDHGITADGTNMSPDDVDNLLSGGSMSLGANTPFFLGVQAIQGASGKAWGPTLGNSEGVSAAWTTSGCKRFGN